MKDHYVYQFELIGADKNACGSLDTSGANLSKRFQEIHTSVWVRWMLMNRGGRSCKKMSNHSLTENIWVKSRNNLPIFAYKSNVSVKPLL
jgi:hypothetical protein